MSFRLPPDPELEDLFDREPGLEPYANLLRSARLSEPPLDPAFRSELRRRLIDEAWRRADSGSARRPSFLDSLFRGPGLAWAGAGIAAVLLAVVVVQLSNQGAPTTSVSYLSSYPTGNIQADQPVTLTFNQAMDHQTVEQAIHIEPATAVKFNWQGNQLTIVPAAATLAPNTQYHVTIAPTALTAAGKPIDKPIAVTFNTQAPPSPAPAPNATPSPTPGIAAERLLGPAASIVGWSAEGGQVVYLGPAGELGVVSVDGLHQSTLVREGVRAAALQPGGSSVAFLRPGTVGIVNIDGSGLQVLAPAEALAVAWAGPRVVYATATATTPPSPVGTATPVASSSPTASPSPRPSPSPSSSPAPGASSGSAVGAVELALPAGATDATFSPSGLRAVFSLGGSTLLAEKGVTVAWPQPAGAPVTWSPDSGAVAFASGGMLFVAAPDGAGRRPLASLATLGLEGSSADLAWSGGDQLLAASNSTVATVRSDGSRAAVLARGEYSHPAWAPVGQRFGFLRAANLWVADLSGGGSTTSLSDTGKVVDGFMQARTAGDAVKAASFLDDSGRQAYAGNPELVIQADPRLRRYYVIAAQLLPAADPGARYVVRLVLARGSNEVFSYDETLTLRPASSGQLLVHSVSAAPRVALGHGPSVISATVKGRLLLIGFDSDLAPETLEPAVKVTDPAGKAIAVKTAYASRVLTVSLPELAPQKGYRLSLATSLQDIDHQPLAVAFDFDFVPSS